MYILVGYAQAATSLCNDPGHARARQVGDHARTGVHHGFKHDDAEGLGTFTRCEAEHVALSEQCVLLSLIHGTQQAYARRLIGEPEFGDQGFKFSA
ncbi:hypothetical protein SDC9_120883 [bioreactor metagenome]|uniref:Uncharacterized protein n=1 Tax=bioreactor metagenome TaxID=1076179 RepID=A0A645CAG6_9ZZZZ